MTHIRPLTATDTPMYRALRRKILASRDAQYFSDSFERERILSDNQWLDWCSEKHEHTILGAFDEAALVGIIMITGQGDKNSPLAEMEAAWVHPHYRGRFGYRLYKAGLDCAKARGYDYVISFLRDNAKTSTRLCKALGYVYAYTVKDEIWADGSIADTHAYLLDLRTTAPKHALEPVHYRFKEAFPFLYQGFHAPSRQEEIEVA